MHGARSGAPQGNRNAWKHGGYSRQSIAFRRCIAELTRAARQVVATIERQRMFFRQDAQIARKAIVESIGGLSRPLSYPFPTSARRPLASSAGRLQVKPNAWSI